MHILLCLIMTSTSIFSLLLLLLLLRFNLPYTFPYGRCSGYTELNGIRCIVSYDLLRVFLGRLFLVDGHILGPASGSCAHQQGILRHLHGVCRDAVNALPAAHLTAALLYDLLTVI